jgi:hypothetical protein
VVTIVKSEVITAVTMKTMKTEKWVVVRDTTGGGEQNLSSVLKVPRHCPFVLPVIVSF